MKNKMDDRIGGFSCNVNNNKKKNMDDQLQQGDSKINWKQTCDDGNSGFEANISSRRNMTTGGPFEPMISMSTGTPFSESGGSFQYPYGPFQPMISMSTSTPFPESGSPFPYVPTSPTSPFFSSTSPFQPTMGTGTGATFPKYGTTCYYEPMLQPPMGMSSGAPYIESRATFQSAPFPCIRIVKDLTSGKNAKDKNFVFSPCSIQLALSLLANGAKGSTLDEILKFVEAEDRNHLNTIAREYVNKLNGSSTEGGPALSLVSGVWVDNSSPLNPAFVTVAENIYHGKAEVVDFKSEVKAKAILDEVNKWAEEATQGIIKSVLPEGSFSPLTRIVLGNALYFKGKWAQKFVKSLTKEFKFHLLDGKCVEVPFMTNRQQQFVRTFDNFKVLRLPYKKSTDENAASFSMYIILPDKIDGLLSLTEMVCSDPLFFKKYLYSPYPIPVWVGSFWVPKFKITLDFEASMVLQNAGLKLPFSPQAEFDDLSLNSGGSLQVTQVVHKSFIEVDEVGTEAAAVSMIMGWSACASSSPPPPPVNFVADHPFMFVIRDDTSGMVLFMGHVVNPLLK